MSTAFHVTNRLNLPLELAVWLLHDDYDHQHIPNYFSATTLIRPVKQIVLPKRIAPEDRIVEDVEDFIARAFGTAVHAAIEKAWRDPEGREKAMRRLGYPQTLIDRLQVNPSPEELAESSDAIPLFLEKRTLREIDGFTIGGKFDLLADGTLSDIKTGSVWGWVFGGNEEDHRKQTSIYRWLNPHLNIKDTAKIFNIFTDWAKHLAIGSDTYPPSRIMPKSITLLSIEETEALIRDKLHQISLFMDVPEEEIPPCTKEELWMSEAKYKYYSDPEKAALGGRSTKNFSSMAEAQHHQATKGKGRGAIVVDPAIAKRCTYCPAFPVCEQRKEWYPLGIIQD